MSKLIIIGGSLATGKTTIAKFLEEKTGIKRIAMDDLKERFFDIGGYRDREWSKRIGHVAWPVFQQLVELHLEHGEDVIAEATFLHPNDADWILKIAKRRSANVFQIWMTADPSVTRERFIHRANNERHPGHCDALEHVIEEFDKRFFCKTFDPLELNCKTLVVDTTCFENVDKKGVLDFLEK
ncbi:ATP-binding protein [Candidatus Uhrbacteria bacterium]|nr:ATP-binding protein [Candidatus Uhrbacteria bacterium]